MKFYIDPMSLRTRKNRLIFKHLVKKFGTFEVIYREPPKKLRYNLLLAIIKVEDNRGLMNTLKKLKFKVSKKPIPALVDIKIVAELLHDRRGKVKPIGVSKDKEYVVFAPAEGKILCDDPGVALMLIRNENTIWIEAKGLNLSAVLTEIPSIPLKSISPRIISDLSLAFSKITIGERYAQEIQRILVEGLGSEMETEEELTIVRPEEKLIKEIFDWNIIKFSTGELPNRAFIDVTGAPLKCQWFAVLFGLFSDYDYVVIHDVPWNIRLQGFLRSNLIWIGDAPKDLFDCVIKDNKIIETVSVNNRSIEIIEEFIPLYSIV